MKNVAVILAAGKSKRTGTEVPKQFIKISGKTVLEYSLDVFEKHKRIDEIAVVVDEEYINNLKEILKKGHYYKVKHILKGGKERYESSLMAVKTYAQMDCNLLIHDAARPLLKAEIVTSCVKELERSEAVIVAVPTTDTIFECSPEGTVANIPSRELFCNAQTPQCFRLKTIAKAFEKALQDPTFSPTDDCSVMRKYLPEVEIKVVAGDEKNIKITYKSDIDYIKFLLST